MHLIALLPAEPLARFRASVGNRHTVHGVASGDALRRAIRRRPADAIVVSAGDLDKPHSEVLNVIAAYDSVPVVVHAALPAVPGGVLATLRSLQRAHLVLEGFDDAPEQLSAFVAALQPVRLTMAVLDRLTDRVSRMPRLLRVALERIFAEPDTSRRVETFVLETTLSRRTVDRCIRDAGLASTRRVVLAPRVVCAYALSQDRSLSEADIARKCTVTRRTLVREIEELTALGDIPTLGALSETSLVARISASLLEQRHSFFPNTLSPNLNLEVTPS